MAEFVKITSDNQLMPAPNPLKIVISNPSDEIYRFHGWLEKKPTEAPEYDPETQYITCRWEEQTIDGVKYAVQVWEIHDIEPIEEETESLDN